MTARLITSLVCAAALGAFAPGAASADDLELRYARSELATDSGAADVYRRIQDVAANVCNDRFGRHSIVKYRAARERCVTDIVKELVGQVSDPRIDDLHAASVRA